jgi:hypothetical protein
VSGTAVALEAQNVYRCGLLGKKARAAGTGPVPQAPSRQRLSSMQSRLPIEAQPTLELDKPRRPEIQLSHRLLDTDCFFGTTPKTNGVRCSQAANRNRVFHSELDGFYSCGLEEQAMGQS